MKKMDARRLFSAWTLGRLFFAAAAALSLWGCASVVVGSPGDGKTDVVTASDEPEARRRARIRMDLAVSYFEDGKTTIALDELKQALVIDPSYAEALNLRGLVYMRLNDLRLAEDSFRRAVALNPRDASALQNVGWLLCQSGRYQEANDAFKQALANPLYGDRAKTYLTMGLCQSKAGLPDDAVHSLTRSYELDAGNPITGYNLAGLLLKRGDLVRAQFYIRRLNNSELANAESLWLGIRVERRMENPVAMQQLAQQLKKRFPQARELVLYERGVFDE